MEGVKGLKVVFNNGGTATTEFTITEKAAEEEVAKASDTGVFTGETGGAVAAGCIGAVIAAAGIAVVSYLRIKRKA